MLGCRDCSIIEQSRQRGMNMEQIKDLAKAFKTLSKAVRERVDESIQHMNETDLYMEKIYIIEELEELREDSDALMRLAERYLY